MFFGEAYRRYWIGNIVEQRFAEIWASQRYWDVMAELASPRFNAQTMCGCLCLQHKVNEFLDGLKNGRHRFTSISCSHAVGAVQNPTSIMRRRKGLPCVPNCSCEIHPCRTTDTDGRSHGPPTRLPRHR